jgi:hypothetical protein
MEKNAEEKSNFLFYQSDDSTIKVQVIIDDDNETVWATQKSMGEIFNVEPNTITYHLGEIYKSNELKEISTTRKIRVVQKEGLRDVNREIDFYNLDIIIAVGYRVNSYQATQFRIWATSILKEFLIKGFALDDDRLKQGKTLFGKDYFEELLERIREIRASERRFYQKITDIYAQCSIDYDAKSPTTKTFFATVQNKLEFAITHHAAPELIKLRASSKKPNMGLTSWKNEKNGGKILKSDVGTAKNYLGYEEIGELNQIVNMYLDYAELQAKRNRTMKMSDWVTRLDTFLAFNEYDLLKDSGKIRKEVATKFAEDEYEKFRVIQDRSYVSDFDKAVETIRITGKLPQPPQRISIKSALEDRDNTNFNKSLKTALEYNPKAKGIDKL